MKLPFILIVIGVSAWLAGCTSDTARAPVVNGWHQPSAASESYVVRQGDTLYSIAWAFGLDYRGLAAANQLQPPYAISTGQRLKMTISPSNRSSSTPVSSLSQHNKQSQPVQAIKKPAQPVQPITSWQWPARGTLFSRYTTSAAGYRGIEIAGQLGQPVYASVAGEVVYSGDGLKGYGNLIIVKHNEVFLTAYAFNQKRLVQLGDKVQAGQKIALMGQNNAGKPVLYFEIRKNGKPVDPLKYLQ